MIDKDRIDRVFREYTDRYDATEVKIRLKIDHTYRVAENAVRIAEALGLEEDRRAFCYCLGMLHDFGRFEQVKTYGTFIDRKSVDHAELGADLLFVKGHIWDFLDEGDLDEGQLGLLELAIRQHNKLRLPEALSEEERLFCNIIRDADKIDIFKVLVEVEYEDGNGQDPVPERDCARDVVMQCVREHRCVPRMDGRSSFEVWVSRMCMAFELVFPISRRITKEQGYLAQILRRKTGTPQEEAQMEEIRGELRYYLDI